jgi:hypothetical protein
MGWMAILIMMILLDNRVFELKMRVKRHPKFTKSKQNRAVFSISQQKLVLFEHFLNHTARVGISDSSCV